MRVLIVDDSSMMRTMIKRVLRLSKVPVEEIYEAENGAEALEILETREVQLLLTDINMPVMNGIDLLRELADDDRWDGLAKVVISTDGSSLRREEVAGLDVRCYVEKPFTPEVMRDVLCEMDGAARS